MVCGDLWISLRVRVPFGAMDRESRSESLAEKSRPMPRIGVCAGCWQSRAHDVVALPAVVLSALLNRKDFFGGCVPGPATFGRKCRSDKGLAIPRRGTV